MSQCLPPDAVPSPPPPVHGRAWRALARVARIILSDDRRRRLRIVQWLMATLVYCGAALVMRDGIDQYWMRTDHLIDWCVFVGTGLVVSYVALRSGWSERFADPSLTEWQIIMAIISVEWAYLICGPMRTITLFPLLVIFAFGAFALRWSRIAGLTAFAIVTLGGVTAYMANFPPQDARAPDAASLSLDRINYLMVLVLLPALAVIAARLSSLRSTLRDKRRELTNALAEVQRLAITDELTSLPNRRWMIERLEQEQRRCDEGDGLFCVCIIDLDHFKLINDRLGHAAGDRVLREFASRARAALSARVMRARWGGEEFLLLLPGLDATASHDSVARLAMSMAAWQVDGQRLTFSAGIAQARPSRPVDETIAMADSGMYRAKDAGRDRIVVAMPTDDASHTSDFTLVG